MLCFVPWVFCVKWHPSVLRCPWSAVWRLKIVISNFALCTQNTWASSQNTWASSAIIPSLLHGVQGWLVDHMQSSWSFCCCCCKTIILNSFIILFKTVEHNVLCLCNDCAWCICLNLVYLCSTTEIGSKCSTIETGSTVVILHCGVAGLFVCVQNCWLKHFVFSFFLLWNIVFCACAIIVLGNICICLNLSVALLKLE